MSAKVGQNLRSSTIAKPALSRSGTYCLGAEKDIMIQSARPQGFLMKL